ncbi:hypothetical protein [Salana multivorans]
MGIGTDLEDREAAQEWEVKLARDVAVRHDPAQVVHVAGGGRAIEAGDLLGEVLLAT